VVIGPALEDGTGSTLARLDPPYEGGLAALTDQPGDRAPVNPAKPQIRPRHMLVLIFEVAAGSEVKKTQWCCPSVIDGVHDVAVVLDMQVVSHHRGRGVLEVNLHIVLAKLGRPEQAGVGNEGMEIGDAWVEVVDLLAGRGTPTRGVEDVESDEAERAMAVLAVRAHEITLHESNVYVEGVRAFRARRGRRSYSGADHVTTAERAVEVEDGAHRTALTKRSE
jgi:hypothetical protein